SAATAMDNTHAETKIIVPAAHHGRWGSKSSDLSAKPRMMGSKSKVRSAIATAPIRRSLERVTRVIAAVRASTAHQPAIAIWNETHLSAASQRPSEPAPNTAAAEKNKSPI